MWAWTTRASRLAPLLIGVLLIGFAFGRFSAGGRAVDAAAPAGSPVAVACTPVATSTPEPSPTPTPSPTVVPPAAVGQSLTYAGEWTVVVMDVALTSTFSDLTPEAGVFAKVSLTMTNNTGDRMRFPYDDLVLLDGNGSTFFPSRGSKLVPEVNWFAWFDPSIPTDGFVIFDIGTDATGPFILESRTDPTFRVEVSLEQRG